METKGITMKARGSIRVLASLALVGFLLTWTGPGPAEAEPASDCTGFQDWNEVDSFWKVFWAGDDPRHRHESAGSHYGHDYDLLRVVKGIGYKHTSMLDKHTIPSGEHGSEATCSGIPS